MARGTSRVDVRDWCSSVLTRQFSPADIASKMKTLEQKAERTFPKSGCFTPQWLAEVLKEIDRLWYDGVLLKEVIRAYGDLTIELDSDSRHVAGYVKESYDKQQLSFHMNPDLFSSLFSQNERGYHAGGLLCSNRLRCALHVILHETVHLALTLCDKLGYREDRRDHGAEFNRMIRNMFGHTDAQHGLIPGYEQQHDLVTIRRRIRPGSRVKVYVEGQWHPARVTKKGYKRVDVTTAAGVSLHVHAGLLQLVEDE